MAPKRTKPVAAKPVGKADIEAKLKEIAGDVEDTVETAKPVALMAGIGGVILLLLLAYLLGKRKGKRKTAVVEIRRV